MIKETENNANQYLKKTWLIKGSSTNNWVDTTRNEMLYIHGILL